MTHINNERVRKVATIAACIVITLTNPGAASAQDLSKMAEHFARCSGAYSAMSKFMTESGSPAQAKVIVNLGNGAEIAAGVAAMERYGGNGFEWATGRREAYRDQFLAEIERDLQEGGDFTESDLKNQLDSCGTTLDLQEQLVNVARELTYGAQGRE